MSDPELTAVRRPFDAAFSRMCQAGDIDLLRDELSNMLHHMYRLSELCRRRWGVNRWSGLNDRVVNVVPGALGAIWIRRYDTHEIASVSTMADLYSDFFSDLYGVLAWKPVASMGFVEEPDKDWALTRYQDYQGLENKAVLDTMRRAFDGLASLL
jgi:hypothetical protein